MDVEGSEALVLEGGSVFFKTVRPVVVCEVLSSRLRSIDKGSDYIFKIFQNWGYDAFIFDIKTSSLIQCGDKQEGDIVFIPNS